MTGKELSAESLLKNFSAELARSKLCNSRVTTSNLSDAMRHVAGENGVLTGVKPVKEGIKIMGTATTVETASDDWGTVIKGIYSSKRGDVLVIKCDNDDPAVWGELASSTAQKRGIIGTVIYGSARDISGIKNLNYPVFSRNIIPNAGDAKAEGYVNVPLNCGETLVNPGDFIMGDECGVVCVPHQILEEVFKEAFSILDNEDEIVAKIKKGSSFLEILGIDK
ncbi:RraA family protein [Methanobacterium aggregans]|uniref:RraA family protein n=1 Tax=Methanobacterium aggregans TaxID=1615586 RepID=UPI00320DC138